MSRLAAVEKLLYYPTDTRIVDLIMSHIEMHGPSVHMGTILDPCAGEGSAVAHLASLLQEEGTKQRREYFARQRYGRNDEVENEAWRTIGVELDVQRAAEAKGRMTQVLQCPFEQVVIQNARSIDVLFLNPPYDMVGGTRAEAYWIELALSHMRDGSTAIFVLPEDCVTGKYAPQIKKAMRGKVGYDMIIARTPPDLYDQWKQIVVMFKTGHGNVREHQWDVVQELGNPKGYKGKLRIHNSRWDVPDHPRVMRMTETPVAQSAFGAGVPIALQHIIGEEDQGAVDLTPLMPMQETHAAMVAASGALNGLEVVLDDVHYLLRGDTIKKQVKMVEREMDPQGNEITTTLDAQKLVSRMTLLALETGEIRSLNSEDHPDEYQNLLVEHAKDFTATAHRTYPPLCSPEVMARWRPFIDQIRAPSVLKGHDNGLFDAQAERVAALLEGWRHLQCVTLDGEMSVGKTAISLATAALKAQARRPGNRVIVIVLPPKDDLLAKWEREAIRSLRDLVNPDGTRGPKVYKVGVKSYTVPKTLIHRKAQERELARLRAEWHKARRGGVSLAHTAGKLKGRIKSLLKKMRSDTVKVKRPIMELEQAFAEKGLTIVLMKSTTAKLGGGGESVPFDLRRNGKVGYSEIWLQGRSIEEYRAKLRPGVTIEPWGEHKARLRAVPMKEACPMCGKFIDEEAEIGKERERKCPECQSVLYTAKGNKWPLATYMRDRYHSRYILIIDEAHEAKGGDTAISYAMTNLSVSAYRVLQMTGTLFGGLASSLFFLLYRNVPAFRQVFSHRDVGRFVQEYGLQAEITRTVPTYKETTFSGYKTFTQGMKEIPGCAPGMLSHLLPSSAFLSLRDLEHNMVQYSEHTLFVTPEKEVWGAIVNFLRQAASEAVREKYAGNGRPMGQYRMARIGITNNINGPDGIDGVRYVPPERIPGDYIYRKEEALLRIVQDAKKRGRKVIVFTGQIERRDPTPRLLRLLGRFGMKGAVMRAAVKKRVPYIEKALGDGADVLFCSPGLVSTGIDLPMFQTEVWYNPEYNMYTVAQANRRAWRLNQEQDVEVYYLAYNMLPEAKAFEWIAEKMAAQQALRGDLRAGLAKILGQDSFVTRLQEAALEGEEKFDSVESDLTLDDFDPIEGYVRLNVPLWGEESDADATETETRAEAEAPHGATFNEWVATVKPEYPDEFKDWLINAGLGGKLSEMSDWDDAYTEFRAQRSTVDTSGRSQWVEIAPPEGNLEEVHEMKDKNIMLEGETPEGVKYVVEGGGEVVIDETAPDPTEELAPGWQRQDLEILAKRLAEGEMVITSAYLAGVPNLRSEFLQGADHIGFGYFRVEKPDGYVTFEGGGGMRKCPSGRTSYCCLGGTSDLTQYYDLEAVRSAVATHLNGGGDPIARMMDSIADTPAAEMCGVGPPDETEQSRADALAEMDAEAKKQAFLEQDNATKDRQQGRDQCTDPKAEPVVVERQTEVVAMGNAGGVAWTATIEGSWTWVKFESKPREVTRAKMHEMGFRWSRKRKAWALAGREMRNYGWLEADVAYDLVPDGVLPALYSTDGQGRDIMVRVKLFALGSHWTWYLAEYDPKTTMAFCLEIGDETGLTYVRVSELAEMQMQMGNLGSIPRVERDLHWAAKTMGEIYDELGLIFPGEAQIVTTPDLTEEAGDLTQKQPFAKNCVRCDQMLKADEFEGQCSSCEKPLCSKCLADDEHCPDCRSELEEEAVAGRVCACDKVADGKALSAGSCKQCGKPLCAVCTEDGKARCAVCSARPVFGQPANGKKRRKRGSIGTGQMTMFNPS